MSIFSTYLVSFVAATYLRLVDATSRTVWINRSVRDKLEDEGRGFLYAFWHGRQVFLVVTHSGPRSHPLISLSKDGDLIARVCRSFGVTAVRGSSSRGGVSALYATQTLLDKGENVGFTPDGPKGPFQEIQPGILYMAQKTGRPIVSVAYGAKKCWTFRGRWDVFLVPKLFNRVSMVYGEPIYVSPEDDLVKKAAELKTMLDHVTEQSDLVAAQGAA